MLAGLVIPDSSVGQALLEQVQRQRRMLDQFWLLDTGSKQLAISLLPLTDAVGVDGYFSRIAKMVEAQFGISLEQTGTTICSVPVSSDTVAYGLSDLIARCECHE